MNMIRYAMCSLMLAGIFNTSESTDQHTRNKYSQADLIRARMAWLGQEKRIGQLKYEAREIAKTTPVRYMNGNVYVADIDDQKQIITTHVTPAVTLTYTEFSAFIRDEALWQEAIRRYTELHPEMKESKG